MSCAVWNWWNWIEPLAALGGLRFANPPYVFQKTSD